MKKTKTKESKCLSDDIFDLIDKKKYNEEELLHFCHAAIITFMKRHKRKSFIVDFSEKDNLFYSIIDKDTKENIINYKESMEAMTKKVKSNPEDYNYIG